MREVLGSLEGPCRLGVSCKVPSGIAALRLSEGLPLEPLASSTIRSLGVPTVPASEKHSLLTLPHWLDRPLKSAVDLDLNGFVFTQA